MFDDQASFPNPPPNLPVEPDDMLAAVDELKPIPATELPTALKSGVLKPKESSGGPRFPEAGENIFPEPKANHTLLIVGGLAFLILIGGIAVWRFYPGFNGAKKAAVNPNISKSSSPSENSNSNAGIPAPTTSVNKTNTDAVLFGDQAVVTTSQENNQIAAPASSTTASVTSTPNSDTATDSLDSDHDGLTDKEEIKLGTNPLNPDTDGDLLSDGDEVHIWHTDPLKKDTDGDGFPDGQEILNGYSPLTPVLKIITDSLTVRFVSSTVSSSFKYVIYPIKK